MEPICDQCQKSHPVATQASTLTKANITDRLKVRNLTEYAQFIETEVCLPLIEYNLYRCELALQDRTTVQFIDCPNAYQRRVTHIIAEALDLHHVRQGNWTESLKDQHFDFQCRCKYCWRGAGEKYFRINTVCVAADIELPLARKDRAHQHHERNQKQASTSA